MISLRYYYTTVLLFLIFISTPIVAQKKISLDEGWKFHFGHAANPDKDFNYSTTTIFSKSSAAVNTAIDPKFVDTTWTSINVPHDWAVELPFEKSTNFDVQSHGEILSVFVLTLKKF